MISEKSFNLLLDCLGDQKFIDDPAAIPQEKIDEYYQNCRNILNQKYVFELTEEGYFLSKRYELQSENTEWSGEDVDLVHELFKDTVMDYEEPTDLLPLDDDDIIMSGTNPIGKTKEGWIVVKAEPRPWLIERAIRYDNEYLTISEDGKLNRPWKKEEVEEIYMLFNKFKKYK